MTEPIIFSRVMEYDDWRVKRDYFLLAEEKWALTLWTGLQIMETLSCPVSIAGSDALEQRPLMPF